MYFNGGILLRQHRIKENNFHFHLMGCWFGVRGGAKGYRGGLYMYVAIYRNMQLGN
jgi:hypothetical protein